MSVVQYPPERVDPHAPIKHELVALQIELWLLEARQAEVRCRLQQCRTRRTGLGRAYRQLVQTTAVSERV